MTTWIVVQSKGCRTALTDDTPWERWYPEGKLVAEHLSELDAQAVAFATDVACNKLGACLRRLEAQDPKRYRTLKRRATLGTKPTGGFGNHRRKE